MTEQEVLEILENVGAFRSGHFVFTSGRHGDSYINKDALYTHTHELSRLCRSVAERFQKSGIEVVLGPAVGAAILSQWVAYHLTELTGKEVYAAFADKDGQGGFVVKRGYEKIMAGKKTLVMEDLTTTGGSLKKVVETARTQGADIVAAVVVCNRGGVQKEDVGNPAEFVSLVNLHLDSWNEDECDLCRTNIPVNTDIGHGRDFVARKSA
ncbi:orotate phosphoribosyltransferase [Candidatus Parcubacteria bacterium]|nr:MAG: orotate phosphoribosyltransferase [Candidatus Parcubacteria bacterium]